MKTSAVHQGGELPPKTSENHHILTISQPALMPIDEPMDKAIIYQLMREGQQFKHPNGCKDCMTATRLIPCPLGQVLVMHLDSLLTMHVHAMKTIISQGSRGE